MPEETAEDDPRKEVRTIVPHTYTQNKTHHFACYVPAPFKFRFHTSACDTGYFSESFVGCFL